ncbi:hypothetical protein ACPDHJ_05880 [Myroides sp. C8-3]|uniref:hypothetical protein n=1 Tax=Myroides sp. C8-3 TaxID=3400533 RepID=UPI003D2F6BDC
MTRELINENLKNISAASIENDFVGIYGEIDESGDCEHVGLIIRYNSNTHLFHFDRTGIHLVPFNISDDTIRYYKKLSLFDHKEKVVDFLGHCEYLKRVIPSNIARNTYLLDSSYFSSTDQEFLIGSDSNLVITTCVGFCIKVIDGAMLENNYINLNDWDESSLSQSYRERTLEYLQRIADEEEKTLEDLFNESDLKRITPSELISSAFIDDHAIRKESIDSIVTLIEEHFREQIDFTPI